MCLDEAQQSGYEVINLGSDEPIVIMDAIRLVEELVGKKAAIEHQPRHPADVLATWADIDKAERLLECIFSAGRGAKLNPCTQTVSGDNCNDDIRSEVRPH